MQKINLLTLILLILLIILVLSIPVHRNIAPNDLVERIALVEAE